MNIPRCLLCGERPAWGTFDAHGKGSGQCSELRVGDLVRSGMSQVIDEIVSGPREDGFFTMRTPEGNFYECPMSHLTRVD